MKLTRVLSLAPICTLAAVLHAQNFTVLHSTNTPQIPSPTLTQTRAGYLMSTGIAPTTSGSSEGAWVYRYTVSGTLTYLYHFPPSVTNYYIQNPSGGMTLGLDGWFYGVTDYGGDYNDGTIVKMSSVGAVQTIHVFTGGQNGGRPFDAPLLTMSGDFYGTTRGDSSDNSASVLYRFTKDGNFTSLHVFTNAGETPAAPLMQATDEWIYGVTGLGGAHSLGSIFRTNRSGQFETVYSFDGAHGTGPNGTLLQGNDGSFYGTTQEGGTGPYGGYGVVYKMSPSHQVSVVHAFTGGSDGAYPYSLVSGTDGNLYGYAQLQDVNGGGGGILFRVTPAGTFTVLHAFDVGSPGDIPIALIQHTNGKLYGDTANETSAMDAAGAWYGIFYSYNLGLSPYVTYLANYGRPGMQVDILGEGFTPDSQVFINGMRAQVISQTSTYITAIVPSGATTGWITVTTSLGTLRSDKKFVVRP
ncbi:MAG TPA: choice-of-anchor tandem repeat GloVer-containing protein [Terracidiphilus sp.]